MTCKECIKKFEIINNTLAARIKSQEKGGICVGCSKLLTKDDFQTTTTKPKTHWSYSDYQKDLGDLGQK
ncbi:hypothetical protein [Borreliella bavariensis]|uniref:hypothetical protein n=1 Tax=Borreliella bavariensis TaxID=664662 RepID=UPI001C004289|nr:hypothetical protein [Borreliella bavariensis]